MNWRGFLSRIALVAVAFPVLAALIFLVPYASHLGFNIVVVAVSVFGGLEMAALFHARGIPTSRYLAAALSATIPAGTYLEVIGLIPVGWMGVWVPLLLAVLLVRGILFQSRKELPSILAFVSSSTLTLLYPGFFMSWIVRLSGLQQPSATILFFLCLVFGNDMAAYFAGSLWGESTRLGLPISPQKSVVGFVAGLVGSLIIVSFFLPVRGFLPYPPAGSYLMGAVVGLTVMLGDLLESGLKRSAGVKDSGIVIPGRGGILDSVDSMVLSAPLFYYAFVLAGR